mmetsp:Transcript_40109/g.78348  ORF Transcript_40109/g.78348 Transcript_40109/m.78348 type:complete len:212 (+) Transcript_40109:411-1046(+)
MLEQRRLSGGDSPNTFLSAGGLCASDGRQCHRDVQRDAGRREDDGVSTEGEEWAVAPVRHCQHGFRRSAAMSPRHDRLRLQQGGRACHDGVRGKGLGVTGNTGERRQSGAHWTWGHVGSPERAARGKRESIFRQGSGKGGGKQDRGCPNETARVSRRGDLRRRLSSGGREFIRHRNQPRRRRRNERGNQGLARRKATQTICDHIYICQFPW